MKWNSIIGSLVILASACSPGIRVYTDYDHDYNVSNYVTYTWADSKDIELKNNPLYYNELNDKRIKVAVDNALAAKGYRQTNDNPGLKLHYHIVIENRQTLLTEPLDNYGLTHNRLQRDAYEYREGSLIIDMMDTKTNTLIWRGWAVSVLEEVYTPEEVEKNIQMAISKIFKKFPQAMDRNAAELDYVNSRQQ